MSEWKKRSKVLEMITEMTRLWWKLVREELPFFLLLPGDRSFMPGLLQLSPLVSTLKVSQLREHRLFNNIIILLPKQEKKEQNNCCYLLVSSPCTPRVFTSLGNSNFSSLQWRTPSIVFHHLLQFPYSSSCLSLFILSCWICLCEWEWWSYTLRNG